MCLAPTQLRTQELLPRLPWGDPDLQGIWFYHTLTPLERPEVFAKTDVLAPDAAAEYVKQQHTNLENAQLRGDWGARAVLTDSRTAQIIDPVNGRIPPRTAAAQQRAETIGSPPSSRTAYGPEDRESLERCIMGRSVPFLGRSFEQRVQIFQTPDYVALKDEFGELRLVALDGRERLSESIRQWGGRSRGHWEGATLVVETTNFNGKWSLRGPVPACDSWSGLSGAQPGRWTTSSRSTTPSRLRARGRRRSRSSEIQVHSMTTRAMRGTGACRSSSAAHARRSG